MFGPKEEGNGMGNAVSALLEKGCEFEGKMSFEGTVRVNGRFKGEVISDGTLVVGEEAHIEARISAGSVIINGTVEGEIIAKDRIEMHSPAKVQGDIQAATLVIDEGVMFEGNCKMGDQPIIVRSSEDRARDSYQTAEQAEEFTAEAI